VNQFFAGNVVSVNPTRTLCYTVPAGDRIVIRSVAVRNLSGTSATTAILWVANTLVWTHSLGVGGTSTDSFEFRPWIVATPGQLIQMAASNSTGFGCVISGSLYTI
jgi:hypothetical protein